MTADQAPAAATATAGATTPLATAGAATQAPGATKPVSMWPGLAFALLGSIAFSGKAIIAKLAYRHGVDAVTVVMYRMLFALPMFLALAWWAGRGQPALTRRDKLAVLGLGFCGYYLASMLDFMGLEYVSASFERLVLYLNPTLVLLLGVAIFGQKVRRQQWVSMAVSYAGGMLVFGHELTLSGRNVVRGAALGFGSALSYAVYLLYSGQEVKRLGSLRLTGLATSVACLFCLAHFAVVKPWSAAMVPAPVIGLSLLNATVCTFAPVLLVMLAIERLGAGVAAQTGMVGPISTILMGVFLLGEPFTPWVAAGTVCVLAGVWLLTRWR